MLRPSFRRSIVISILSFVLGNIFGCCDCITHSLKIGFAPVISKTISLHSRISRDSYRSVRQNQVGPLKRANRHCIGGFFLGSVHRWTSLFSMSSASPQTQRGSLREALKVDDKHRNRKRTDAQVVGHRGAIYRYLENTMESFMYCANTCQCNAVELDVFVIKDGTLVVFHGCDSNPNMPGSLQGYCLPDAQADLVLAKDGCTYRSIIDLTYEETQQLKFNPHFEEFVCPKDCIVNAKIPKLHDVLLQLSKTNLQEVKIELKGPGTVEPVLSLVEQLKLERLCSYSSFDHAQLQELRTLRPNKLLYRTGALFNALLCDDDYLQRASMCGATAIHLRYDDCTVDRINNIHKNNFVSMAWCRGPIGMANDALTRFNDIGGDVVDATNPESNNHSLIENEACYRTLLDTGVQQICCNRPDLLMSILSEN
jgi:glycerophosphoryl diester phosphodiesterase